jgi:formylmethanofuran dehydrogenase subunit C
LDRIVLTLNYFAQTTVPVEIEGLTPDWAHDKSLAQIERFEIFHGNQKLPLAELLIQFEGNLSGVHWIGARMASGTIRIMGSVGRHVGSDMTGGEIIVEGDTGIWLGAEMHGGFIHARGNAGHLVGSAYRGGLKGMTGGTILVEGSAGDEIGTSMRRGLIAVGGSAGQMVGFNLIAGTILVFGECGIRPGAGMRRGTLGLFGPNPPELLPSFRYGSTYRPQVVALMLRELMAQGLTIDPTLLSSDFDLFQGDLVTLGRGEILFRHDPFNRARGTCSSS